MKDECKKHMVSTILRDVDGQKYNAVKIDCLKCQKRFECEGTEKLYELIVYDNEINKDSLYELNEVN